MAINQELVKRQEGEIEDVIKRKIILRMIQKMTD